MDSEFVTAFRRAGAMTWTRYLMKSLDCSVRWLNRTLLLPPSDPSGVLSDRLAPRLFEEIHTQGKNPDGKYWEELNDSGEKFNIFRRACERVPKSEEWLLRDLMLYTKPAPPSILDSRSKLLAYINQRDLIFVPPHILYSLQQQVPLLYQELERECIGGLEKAATPSTLLFLFAYLHELTWRRAPLQNNWTKALAEKAVGEFAGSFSKREFADPDMLSERLRSPLLDTVSQLATWGDRCAPSPTPAVLEEIPLLPFLMEKSLRLRDACACLDAVSFGSARCLGRPLPERYREGAHEGFYPTYANVDAALKVLVGSMLSVHRRIAREYEDSLLISPAAGREMTRATPGRGRADRVSSGRRLDSRSSRARLP